MEGLVPKESLQTFDRLSTELAGLAHAAGPLVVGVHGRRRWPSTGVVWGDRLVVTAAHAIRRRGEVPITLADETTTQGAVLGVDAATDLAVLKTTAPATSFMPMADSRALAVGMLGLVVSRRASGAVAATLASVRSPWRAGRRVLAPVQDGAFLLSVAAYPGLSGSPFLTANGCVAGVAIGGFGPGAVLIPAHVVSRVVDEIAAKGRVSAPYLGIATQPAQLPERLLQPLGLDRPDGILLVGTQPDGPADSAGWLIGDVLVQLGVTATPDLEGLQVALAAATVGEATPARLVRGGEMKTLPIRVGERPRSRC